MNASVNTIRPPSTESMLSVLSRRMSGVPDMSGGPAGRPPSMLENALNERMGLVTPERLMAAAKSKQQQHIMMLNSRFNSQFPPHSFEGNPLDLSTPKNQNLLHEVSLDILHNSRPGDSIKKMADKVVVMCICLHEDPALNKNNLILAVNNVFMHWGRPTDDIDRAVLHVMTRLQALRNRGGFHKKTKCRRNKMRKSRKSRSRR